jgi:hypothetical protein
MNKRLGVYNISYEQMAVFLNLPEDHKVVDVISDINRIKSSFLVKVIGPRMPEVPECQEAMWVPLDFLVNEE